MLLAYFMLNLSQLLIKKIGQGIPIFRIIFPYELRSVVTQIDPHWDIYWQNNLNHVFSQSM